MRLKKQQQLYTIELEVGVTTKTVKVRAASREVAERRALKRNPGASRVKRA